MGCGYAERYFHSPSPAAGIIAEIEITIIEYGEHPRAHLKRQWWCNDNNRKYIETSPLLACRGNPLSPHFLPSRSFSFNDAGSGN